MVFVKQVLTRLFCLMATLNFASFPIFYACICLKKKGNLKP